MPKLIECPVCNKSVSENAMTCPHCGETLRKRKCRSVKGGFISLGIGILLLILGVAIGNSMPSDGVTVHPLVYLGVLALIGGIAGACVCFTAPSR